jgi:peptidoglycan/LPS O-acetylase OafA/YrhL
MIKEKRSQKLPSLDGWRAVSIALVLLDHSGYTSGFPMALEPLVHGWFGTGPLGVLFSLSSADFSSLGCSCKNR